MRAHGVQMWVVTNNSAMLVHFVCFELFYFLFFNCYAVLVLQILISPDSGIWCTLLFIWFTFCFLPFLPNRNGLLILWWLCASPVASVCCLFLVVVRSCSYSGFLFCLLVAVTSSPLFGPHPRCSRLSRVGMPCHFLLLHRTCLCWCFSSLMVRLLVPVSRHLMSSPAYVSLSLMLSTCAYWHNLLVRHPRMWCIHRVFLPSLLVYLASLGSLSMRMSFMCSCPNLCL